MSNRNHSSTNHPLRILFVNRMAATERGGGETFDLEMARQLMSRGHEVTVLSNRPLIGFRPAPRFAGCRGMNGGRTRSSRMLGFGSLRRTLKPNKEQRTKNEEHSKPEFRFVLLRSPMFHWFPWDKVKAGWRVRVVEFWLFEKRAASWVWRNRDQFDVIQVCELPFFVSAFKAKMDKYPEVACPKVSMRLTAPDFYDVEDAVREADAVIASGDTLRRVRAERRPDCLDVPNGVDLRRFQACPELRGVSGFRFQEEESQSSEVGCRRSEVIGQGNEERRATNEEQRTFSLLYVARFFNVKDHDMLLRAFVRVHDVLPQSRLVLAGSGPLRSAMERQARGLGVTESVEFLGEVPYDQLPALYEAADINVIASFYESFCFAVLEGMASGLPHVVTATNWVPRLLGDKQADSPDKGIREVHGGLIVPVRDADLFAQAVIRLAGDPALRRKMGAWNRAKAEKEYGWESSAAKLERIYQNLIEAK